VGNTSAPIEEVSRDARSHVPIGAAKVKMNRSVGIDFGTTNSALAVADGHDLKLASFGPGLETFRSVLFFEGNKRALAGPAAIERYLEEADDDHPARRLIQSIKSLLASSVFTATQIGGRRYSAADLVTIIVRALRTEAERELGPLGNHIVVGRPVRFVGAESDDDEALALDRLREAFGNAGFDKVKFEYEPVGAAYFYESRLDHDELILIADFGGGTSDFSLLHVGPSYRKKKRKILATEGIPLAGDAFDARIVRNVVSPLLGEGSNYRSIDKMLPVPGSLYRKLERWHHLSFLRSPDTMRMLKGLLPQADEREKLETLIEVIENDLGYHLHRAVQKTKFELSRQQTSRFSFQHAGLKIEHTVERADFEEWIAPELDQIAEGVESAMKAAQTEPAQIDRVFLTGGTSLVPAVQHIFQNRFGAGKLSAGDELTSVAKGLALTSHK
jgi:hypothetical chaperone protein